MLRAFIILMIWWAGWAGWCVGVDQRHLGPDDVSPETAKWLGAAWPLFGFIYVGHTLSCDNRCTHDN